MREKVRPKMGKIDIDYQKLHDAFFRWQVKPKMTIHGDLYYEVNIVQFNLRPSFCLLFCSPHYSSETTDGIFMKFCTCTGLGLWLCVNCFLYEDIINLSIQNIATSLMVLVEHYSTDYLN